MYSKILKKKKKEIEELAPGAKPLHMGKKMAEHAMSSMEPEMEDEEEGEEYEQEGKGKLSKSDMSKFEGAKSLKKGILPEAKIEIELILEGSKKKKK